ncbi:DNA repair protein rad51d [Polyrhizophydium stewartii]|uniref:DNA repair protein rad51d n=1 Tax=Polyrhizophydium stewartii TaxID=2732419 RepID=A0ABR4MWH3_9FUNG
MLLSRAAESWPDAARWTPLVQRMQRAGVRTVADVVFGDAARLAERGGCSLQDAAALQAAATAGSCPPAVGASELKAAERRARPLTTGIARIDDMLDGGLRAGEIVELAGVAASGKTQMCHLITAATVGARSDTTVVFVDSGGSFSAGRVLSMLTSSATLRPLLRCDLDPHEALSRIQHVRCFSVFAAVGFLESVLGSWGTAAAAAGTAAAQRAPPARPSLIIVDSVGQLLSPIVGQGGFATMGTFAELLIEIARALMIPVVASALAVNTSVSAGFQDTQPDSQEPPGNQPAAADLVPSTAGSRETMTKPALGAMWDAVPTFRLFFTQAHDDGRAALYRVYDHDAAASAAIAEQLALTMAGPAGDPVRVVRNHVELLDGPSKQRLGERCDLFVSGTEVLCSSSRRT